MFPDTQCNVGLNQNDVMSDLHFKIIILILHIVIVIITKTYWYNIFTYWQWDYEKKIYSRGEKKFNMFQLFVIKCIADYKS